MKKILNKSFLYAAFSILFLLLLSFFFNTNKQYLILIPIVEASGGYFAFKSVLNRNKDKEIGKLAPIIISAPIMLAVIITGSIIGLLYLF